MTATNQIVLFDRGYIPDSQEPIMESIFNQYERVLLESLVTSFGLDFLVKDQHGGDVDTIYNVRQIDSDPRMHYKNVQNQKEYENQPAYDYNLYHGKNENYRSMLHDAREQFKSSGTHVNDAYTGGKLYFGNGLKPQERASVDHVLTAHTIARDRGRCLAGLDGSQLANSKYNLVFTSCSMNSKMGATKESSVLVDIPQYLKNNPSLSLSERHALNKIGLEKGGNGRVDILRIIDSPEIPLGLKEKISQNYKLSINIKEFVGRNPNLKEEDKKSLASIPTDKNGRIDIMALEKNSTISKALKRQIKTQIKEPVDIPRYIELHPELDNKTKADLMQIYNNSLKPYNAECSMKYYISPKFRRDLTYAATNVGLRMGIRQALGFVFAEMWFAVKDKFAELDDTDASLEEYLKAMSEGIRCGYKNVQTKYPELCSRFLSGAVGGALSSLTTTLCNIFFTTSKNVVRIIRQSYASLVEAVKVLFVNPDNYEFGDRMRAVVKVLSVGASVAVGVVVSDAMAHTSLGAFGTIGDTVQNFCGAFVTGIMSCTLLMYLDKDETINKLVRSLNEIHTVETVLHSYQEWGKYLDRYAAELMSIDFDTFEREIQAFHTIVNKIDSAQTENELNHILINAFVSLGLSNPWEGYDSFDSFMSDKTAHLVFQ